MLICSMLDSNLILQFEKAQTCSYGKTRRKKTFVLIMYKSTQINLKQMKRVTYSNINYEQCSTKRYLTHGNF